MKIIKVIVAFVLALPLLGCSNKRSISLTARNEGSDLILGIKTNGINGLLGLAIWQKDSKEYFWKVNLNYYNETTLIYGQIPSRFRTFTGTQSSAKQEFPLGGIKPLALTRGKTFCVAVTCQYDAQMAASCGVFYFLATTDSSGAVVSLIPTSPIDPPAAQ